MSPTEIIEYWLGSAPDDLESVTEASKRWYRGFDRELGCAGRAFLYHPFEHSEDPEDQERSVLLFETLLAEAPPPWREFAAGFVPYAHSHRDVIRQYGRFPHRNEILGRRSTPREEAHLAASRGF